MGRLMVPTHGCRLAALTPTFTACAALGSRRAQPTAQPAPVAVDTEAGAGKDEEIQVLKEGASRGMGFALLASVTLNGVPENLALSASLQQEASLTLLLAIIASNLPESLVGAMAMRKGGQRPLSVILIWSGAAVILICLNHRPRFFR